MAWSRLFRPAGAAASGLVLSGGLVAPHPAAARDWRSSGDAGVYFGYRFGGGRGGRFAFGLQARGVAIDRTETCSGYMNDFAGAVARLELTGWHEKRLTIGPTVGSTNGMAGYAFDGTAGYAFGGDAPGPLAQIEADGMGIILLDARVAYSIGRDWLVGGGLHFPPFSTSAFCVVGRRLRRDDGPARLAGAVVARLPSRRRAPGAEADLGGETSLRAARVWTDRARLEWASVPAFCELAAQLQACRAPADLIARARAAAADELRHAVISATLAAGGAGTGFVSLDPPAPDERKPASGRAGLVRLAVESFVDGCVSEAGAAAIAADEAVAADGVDVRRAQRTIAADEARHAALAWAIVEWAAAVDPPGVRPALRAALSAGERDASGTPPSPSPGGGEHVRLDGLTSFGILDAGRTSRVQACEARQARQRLRAHLAG